jgi:hypothetical protein
MTTTPRTNRRSAKSAHSDRLALFGLLAILAALVPTSVFGLAITPGSDLTGTLGSLANDIVLLNDPGGLGSGTVIQVTNFNGGLDIDVLTADHVIRDDSSSGAGTIGGAIYAPGLITNTFQNGSKFVGTDEATDFTIPTGGGSAVDLAMVDIFVPGSLTNTLPAGLTAALLPSSRPGANASIVQAGYGRQAIVTNLGGTLYYGNSTVFNWGSPAGTLKAGPNSLNSSGVLAINGAVSGFSNNTGFVQYKYQGFQNGALINGTAPNYNGSTSYILGGDSGGPSFLTNTSVIVGVHSSSGTITNSDPNSQIVLPGGTNGFVWSDVSVYDNLPWINMELATLSIPEPSSVALVTVGSVAVLWQQYRLRKRRGSNRLG